MSDNEQVSDIGTIYNPVLCRERMDRLKESIGNGDKTLQSELTAGLTSVRNEVHNCQEKMLTKFDAESKLAILINNGRQDAITAALVKIDSASVEQDAIIENLKLYIDSVEDLIPTKCIKRVAQLESERKIVMGFFGATGLSIFIFYKYIEHVLEQHAEIIAQAGKLIKDLEKYTGLIQ